jgi:light-independent protochlorophyllide reductase subunit B
MGQGSEPLHQGLETVAAGMAVMPAPAPSSATATLEGPRPEVGPIEPRWGPDGEAELHKIPFFVRTKVRRNTESFARDRGIALIDAETLYDAKAHYSR